MLEEIVIKKESEEKICLSCWCISDEKNPVFRSNCKCHDLLLCTKCWQQWLTCTAIPQRIKYNTEKRLNIIYCSKCKKQSFIIDKYEKRLELDICFKIIIFICTSMMLNFIWKVINIASNALNDIVFYILCIGLSFITLELLQSVEIHEVESKDLYEELSNSYYYMRNNKGNFLEFSVIK